MISVNVRNFLCEYTLDEPNELNDGFAVPNARNLPTIHLFGILGNGRKACVHVHGVLPYMLVRVGGQMTDRVEYLIRTKVNKSLHHEMIQGNVPDGAKIPDYVHHIEEFEAKSIYGHQAEREPFAKVFFANPIYVMKLFRALARECPDNPSLQPFEAHIPFILQFFIDNSIFGMDHVHFSKVKFRINPNRAESDVLVDGFSVANIRELNAISPLQHSTNCWAELDVFAEDIMNKELHNQNVHSSNPGLEYIWKEEASRCQLQGRELKDTFNSYEPRPQKILPSEKASLSTLKITARNFREQLEHRPLDVTINLNDTMPQSPAFSQKSDEFAELIWSQQSKSNIFDETSPLILNEVEQVDELDEDLEDEETISAEMQQTFYQATQIPFENEETTEPNIPNEFEWSDSKGNTIVGSDKSTETKDEDSGSGEEDSNFQLKRKKQPFRPTKHCDVQWMEFNENLLPLVCRSKESQFEEMPDSDDDSDSSTESEKSDQKITVANTFVDPKKASICNKMNFDNTTVNRTSDKKIENEDELSGMDGDVDEIAFLCVASLEVFSFTVDTMPNPQTDPIVAVALFITEDTCRNLSPALNVVITTSNELKKGSEFVQDEATLLDRVIYYVQQSYDRGTACLAVLDEKLPMLNDRSLSNMLQSPHPDTRHTILLYLIRLASFNTILLSNMDFFLRNAEMARVYGIQFHEVWTRGSQFRVESMMLRLAHKMDYIAPSITVDQRNEMCAPEQLQLILEPESKVYHDPVIVLDFQSLYPSMVIAYNYCYSTLLGKVSHLNAISELNGNQIEMGGLKVTVDKATIIDSVASKKVHVSPLGAAYVRKESRDGILPILLREVLGARVMIKTSMKHTKSKRLLRILDARQLALKNVANVTYGYTAANWSGRMPCVEIADAILGKGRETLERAIELVTKGDYNGARVIYGDTDSMFVLVPGASLKEAFEIGKRIANDVTEDNPTPVVLKLEKVYTGCVLETKKRYAGWMFESPEDQGRLDSKGIETVRRDTCPVVAKLLERSLELILQHDYSGFGEYIDRKLTTLDCRPYTDFIFCKEYRSEYKENSYIPQKEVAEYMQRNAPAHFVLRGERLPYVIVNGHPTDTILSCVRPLDVFLADPDLTINIQYYTRAHIMAAIRRVTDLIPLSVNWKAAKAHHCFTRDCSTVGSKPWCMNCIVDRDAFVQATVSVSREQRLIATTRKICSRCMETRYVSIEACANHACIVKQVINEIDRSFAEYALDEHDIPHRKQQSQHHRSGDIRIPLHSTKV